MKSVVTSPRRKKSPLSPLLLVVILLAVAATAYFMKGRVTSSNSLEMPQEQLAPAQEKPVAVVTSVETNMAERQLAPADKDATLSVGKKKPISKEQERLRANYVYPTPGQAKLPDGFIVTFKVPEEGHTVKFVVDHDRYVCNPDGTYEIIKYTPIFEDKFEEQMINFAMPGGTFIPFVLLNHTEEELKSMLDREVVINPDDSDDVKEKKQAVAEMKVMIKEYLADGGNFVDFVNEMHKYSKEERKLRTKGLSRVEDLVERGEIDAARAFIKQYNEVLDENNFPPMRLPKRIKEAVGDISAVEETAGEDLPAEGAL